MQRIYMNKKKNVRSSNKYNHFVKQNLVLTIFQLIFLIGIVISLITILKWNLLNQHTKKEKEIAKEAIIYSKDSYGITKQNSYAIDFEKLKEINQDTVAWIKIAGTKIEYPVVQAKDNNYYLYHSFDKSANNAGWVFMDYRNNADINDKNTIIYGHNRKDGSIFGSLKNTLNATWYENKDNLDIEVWTEKKQYVYKVFSVYETEVNDYYISTSFDNYINFLNNIKSMSIKDFGIDLNEESRILTLSTCANTSEKRVVLHAVKANNSDM